MIDENELKNFKRFKFMDMAEELVKIHKAASEPDSQEKNGFISNISETIDSLSNISQDERNKLKDYLNTKNLNICVKKIDPYFDFSDADINANEKLVISSSDKTTSPFPADILYALAHTTSYLERINMRRMANILTNHYIIYSENIINLPMIYFYQFLHNLKNGYLSDDKNRLLNSEGFSIKNNSNGCIVAVGGLSGSGKSRLSREIAPYFFPSPGAVILRSDVIRKKICNVLPHEKLATEYYVPEMDEKTYNRMFAEAIKLASEGIPIIIDGVFAKEEERQKIEKLANDYNIDFTGIWVSAGIDARTSRVETRKRNVSDIKTRNVLEKQLKYDLGKIKWHIIDSSGDKNITVTNAIDMLRSNHSRLLQNKS